MSLKATSTLPASVQALVARPSEAAPLQQLTHALDADFDSGVWGVQVLWRVPLGFAPTHALCAAEVERKLGNLLAMFAQTGSIL